MRRVLYEVEPDRKRAEASVLSEPWADGQAWKLVDSFEQAGVRYIVVCDEAAATEALLALTEREREIVSQGLRGASNKEIAQALGISDATVRVLMSRAANRFGVRKRKELLAHPALQKLLTAG